MGNRRGNWSPGTILMLGLTAVVIVGFCLCLTRLAGRDLYARASDVLSQWAQHRTAAPDTPSPAPARTPLPSPTAMPTETPTAVPTPVPTRAPAVITIAAAGTVYAPKAVRESAFHRGGQYDFTAMFQGLGDALASADLSIATLETTCAGERKGYANYNAPPQLLDALRGVGVDLVSLATERALDWGYEGLDVTLSELTTRSLLSAGVSREGGAARPVMMQIDGVQVAVLAYAYGLSDEGYDRTQGDTRGVLALLDAERAAQEITQARVDGAEVVIVLPHWGTKNQPDVSDTVRAQARRLAEAGADLILGAHPNVPQPIERLRVTRADGLDYETLVCYSLGSLLTDARTALNTASILVQAQLRYDPAVRRVTLDAVTVKPLYIARQREGSAYRYRVVAAESDEALALLTDAEREAAAQAAQLVYSAIEE